MKVLTVGTFDTPHSGHVALFNKCRRLADLEHRDAIYQRNLEGNRYEKGEVVVGVNTDAFVYGYKGSYPVYPYAERVAVVNSIGSVDKVIPNDNQSLRQMLITQMPDFLVIGSDWACKDYYKQISVTEQWLQQNNIMLIYVPYTQGISSTYLKERLSRQ